MRSVGRSEPAVLRALLVAVILSVPACGTTTAGTPPQTPQQPEHLSPIRVRVYPRVALPPIQRVNIEILIVRHPDNRQYCLEVDGPGLYSESCAGIPGLMAPFLHTRYVLGFFAEGRYRVTAKLFRQPDLDKPFSAASTVVQAGTETLTSLR